MTKNHLQRFSARFGAERGLGLQSGLGIGEDGVTGLRTGNPTPAPVRQSKPTTTAAHPATVHPSNSVIIERPAPITSKSSIAPSPTPTSDAKTSSKTPAPNLKPSLHTLEPLEDGLASASGTDMPGILRGDSDKEEADGGGFRRTKIKKRIFSAGTGVEEGEDWGERATRKAPVIKPRNSFEDSGVEFTKGRHHGLLIEGGALRVGVVRVVDEEGADGSTPEAFAHILDALEVVIDVFPCSANVENRAGSRNATFAQIPAGEWTVLVAIACAFDQRREDPPPDCSFGSGGSDSAGEALTLDE
ncbi:hypothetical protein BDK51DRAFT_49925 [Blyttiomyces helicus]|uniref:Uncharacterized protein n=1 Tax=Blyttiomyces helicus TaxID=388810 RepID=A0A4P9W8T9_9FUNG|nr:hypothetical protein BDK51DRAFT_49925 [Blyttiomyces helicus]|eukprot:RKO88949.1 hypothetical protein BDK51DRAFT_49925 [Blyttiomyces helicus]